VVDGDARVVRFSSDHYHIMAVKANCGNGLLDKLGNDQQLSHMKRFAPFNAPILYRQLGKDF